MQNNMKLYATITDSRGKKDGKGDNEYLEIMLSEKNDNRFLISYNGDKIQILNYCTGEKTIIEYQAINGKQIKCFWCKENATIKDYREIDDTTGSYPSCKTCFNLSTETLLKKEQKAEKQKDDLCPSGHKQDADGRCKCTNSDSN